MFLKRSRVYNYYYLAAPASSPVKCFSAAAAASVGVGTRREKSKNSAARARLFFALASKNSAAAPVVSRVRGASGHSFSHDSGGRGGGGGGSARTQHHVHVVCVLRRARAKRGPAAGDPIVYACVFCVIVIFKAAAASNRPHNFRIALSHSLTRAHSLTLRAPPSFAAARFHLAARRVLRTGC